MDVWAELESSPSAQRSIKPTRSMVFAQDNPCLGEFALNRQPCQLMSPEHKDSGLWKDDVVYLFVCLFVCLFVLPFSFVSLVYFCLCFECFSVCLLGCVSVCRGQPYVWTLGLKQPRHSRLRRDWRDDVTIGGCHCTWSASSSHIGLTIPSQTIPLRLPLLEQNCWTAFYPKGLHPLQCRKVPLRFWTCYSSPSKPTYHPSLVPAFATEVAQVFRTTQAKTRCTGATLPQTMGLLEIVLATRAQEDDE